MSSPAADIPGMKEEVKPLNLIVITDGGVFELILRAK